MIVQKLVLYVIFYTNQNLDTISYCDPAVENARSFGTDVAVMPT